MYRLKFNWSSQFSSKTSTFDSSYAAVSWDERCEHVHWLRLEIKKMKFARFFFLLLVTTESLNLNLQFTTFFFINIFSLCDFATLCEPVEWGKKSETNVQHVFGALLLFAQLNMLFLLFFLHVFLCFCSTRFSHSYVLLQARRWFIYRQTHEFPQDEEFFMFFYCRNKSCTENFRSFSIN